MGGVALGCSLLVSGVLQSFGRNGLRVMTSLTVSQRVSAESVYESAQL